MIDSHMTSVVGSHKYSNFDDDISFNDEYDKENMEKTPMSLSTPKLRRLPRQSRCSEIANPFVLEPLTRRKSSLLQQVFETD